MPDQERIAGWLNSSELQGHFPHIDRIKDFAEYMDYPYFGKIEMRGFSTRVLDGVYHARNRTLFVTSERVGHMHGPSGPRHYNIRRIRVVTSTGDLSIDIGSEGPYPWPTFTSARAARAAICRLIDAEEATEPTPDDLVRSAAANALVAEKEAASARRAAWWTPEAVQEREAKRLAARAAAGL